MKLCLSKCESDSVEYSKCESDSEEREEREGEVHDALIFMLLHLSNDVALYPMTR
jgi:hypothetical protein